LNLNPKTQARKGIIIYNLINGIIALKKHVNLKHSNVLNFFEEEVSILSFEGRRKTTFQKYIKYFLKLHTYFIFYKRTFQRKRMCNKKKIWKTLVF